MALEVITVPCLSDNYAYLIRCTQTGQTGVADAPEAAPIRAALNAQGWSLDTILLTHHHDDHIAGVGELVSEFGAKTVGAAADAKRLPRLDQAVSDGDTIRFGAESARIIDVSGHTINHIAFLFENAKAAFTGDSLMALGCGRVFEGSKPQMWESLMKFRSLDPETQIYSGHEYTAANAAFALSIEPENAALKARAAEIADTRSRGGYTVPSSLGLELATNPFLRADMPETQAAIGMSGATPAEVFTEIRTRKDNF